MTIKELKIQLALGSLPIADRMKLANSKSTSKEILSILSTDEVYYVRRNVAFNPSTPKEVLKELSKDKYWR